MIIIKQTQIKNIQIIYSFHFNIDIHIIIKIIGYTKQPLLLRIIFWAY